MAIPLKDLIADPTKLELLKGPPTRCVLCGDEITEGDVQAEEEQRYANGRAHKDCIRDFEMDMLFPDADPAWKDMN